MTDLAKLAYMAYHAMEHAPSDQEWKDLKGRVRWERVAAVIKASIEEQHFKTGTYDDENHDQHSGR